MQIQMRVVANLQGYWAEGGVGTGLDRARPNVRDALNEFVPLRISVPAPVLEREPVPLIADEQVRVERSEKTSVALSTIFPASSPSLPLPSPNCSVPALRVVVPLIVLMLARTSARCRSSSGSRCR